MLPATHDTCFPCYMLIMLCAVMEHAAQACPDPRFHVLHCTCCQQYSLCMLPAARAICQLCYALPMLRAAQACRPHCLLFMPLYTYRIPRYTAYDTSHPSLLPTRYSLPTILAAHNTRCPRYLLPTIIAAHDTRSRYLLPTLLAAHDTRCPQHSLPTILAAHDTCYHVTRCTRRRC